MATADEYAQWIIDNEDLEGTDDFNDVAEAYEIAKAEETQEPEEEGGFLERTGERLGERMDSIGETISDAFSGDLADVKTEARTELGQEVRDIRGEKSTADKVADTLGVATTQIAGDVAGAAFDIMGEGFQSAWNYAKDLGAKDALKFIANTEAGQTVESELNFFFNKTPAGKALAGIATGAVEDGYEAWKDLEESNPQLAKTVSKAVNVGLLVAPTGAKVTKAKRTKMMENASRKLEIKAIAQERREKRKRLVDMVKDESESIADRASTNKFGTIIVKPSKEDLAIAKEVAKVKGVSGKGAITNNYNMVRQNVDDDVTSLAKLLDEMMPDESEYVREYAMKSLGNDIRYALQNNKMILGEETMVKKLEAMAESAAKELVNGKANIGGILRIRQKLDNELLEFMPRKKLFGKAAGGLENPVSIAHKVIRDSLNRTVNDLSGGVVSKRLRSQSLKLRGLENMRPKVDNEMVYLVNRIFHKIAPFATSIRSETLNTAALALGTTALGASTLISPYIGAGVGAAILARTIYKGMTGPQAKRGIANLIKSVDEVIMQSKDPKFLRTLRADRAALIELLENYDHLYKPEQETR